MDKFFAQKYYSRPEIQQAILEFAKDREIGVMFDGYFGKRPDVIEYLTDVKALVKKGVFSFHCSEERWENALLLGSEGGEDERAKNRVGWDLILDLDGVDFVYSQYLGKVIIDYLEELGIKNVSLKFSGNKGFHLGIPFEAFSKECPGLVSGVSETRLLFPDVAKKTVLFLLHELKGRISKIILDSEGGGRKAIGIICERYGIEESDLEFDEENYTFNFMKVIEIDTILITSRHLFRMPYSLNEKSGLVSVPLAKEKILDFKRDWARPNNVKPEFDRKYAFLKYDEKYGQDGNILLEKVYSDEDYMYDEMYKEYENKIKSKRSGEFVLEIDESVEIGDFPDSIKYILDNDVEDGRKRALFLLMTFLTSIKWNYETIEEFVYGWNDKLSKSLKKNYVQAQLSWFKAQNKVLSPPNYENDNYFVGIGIPKEIVEKDRRRFKGITAKNPLHYVYLLLQSRKKVKE